MQRISVVLPDPDGPSGPVIVPQVTDRNILQGKAFTTDDAQLVDDDRGSAPQEVIHHLMKSSCDEYPPVVRVCQGPVHNRL